MDIQFVLTTANPVVEFVAPGEEYGRNGVFALVLSGASATNTVAVDRYVPADVCVLTGATLAEAWIPTGDVYEETGEYGLRSMGQGRMRLLLTGAGPVRGRLWNGVGKDRG